MASLVCRAHREVRAADGDSSAVSLRDVKRFLGLALWFRENFPRVGDKVQEHAARLRRQKQAAAAAAQVGGGGGGGGGSSGRSGSSGVAGGARGAAATKGAAPGSAAGRRGPVALSPLATSTVLALAHVYYYRLATAEQRAGFWRAMQATVAENWASALGQLGWTDLSTTALGEGWAFRSVLDHLQGRFARSMQMEEGIALNEALRENIFVVVVCVLNKIPVFVVGKPGTSKTLTMQVLQSNLRGVASPSELWRRFPALHIVQYQCSPLSSAGAIQHQFDMAVSYHEVSAQARERE